MKRSVQAAAVRGAVERAASSLVASPTELCEALLLAAIEAVTDEHGPDGLHAVNALYNQTLARKAREMGMRVGT